MPHWIDSTSYSSGGRPGSLTWKKEWITTQNSLVHSNMEETQIGFPAPISNSFSKCFVSRRRDCEGLPLKHLPALCPVANENTWGRANWSWAGPSWWRGAAVHSCPLCSGVGQSSLTSSCAHCHGAEDRVVLPAGTWSRSCWSAGLFSLLRLRGRGRQACSVECRTRTNRGEFRGPLPVLGASSRNTGSVPPSTAVLTALTKGVQKSWRSSQKNLGTFACPLIPADKPENAELVFLHALCSGC